jgi:hypothetical protein
MMQKPISFSHVLEKAFNVINNCYSFKYRIVVTISKFSRETCVNKISFFIVKRQM